MKKNDKGITMLSLVVMLVVLMMVSNNYYVLWK